MLEGSQTSFQIIRQLYWWSQICLQPVARGLTCCPLCYSAHLSPHIFNYLFTRTAAGAESRSSFILLFKLVLNSTLSCIKRSLKLSFVKLPHSSFLLITFLDHPVFLLCLDLGVLLSAPPPRPRPSLSFNASSTLKSSSSVSHFVIISHNSRGHSVSVFSERVWEADSKWRDWKRQRLYQDLY